MMKIIGVHQIEAPEPCFLVEVSFETPAEDYNWGEVTQKEEGQPESNWQVPYDEQPLDDTNKRWAFFFHYLDCGKPLLTPEGPVKIPEATTLPKHLQNIEYEEP